MKIVIVTDAWKPQVNGVVTTLKQMVDYLESKGCFQVKVIEPSSFSTIPLPFYQEIRLAINPWKIDQLITCYNPDAVHIATEGPLGLAARNFCIRRNIPFNTALHTRFPEYIHSRIGLPLKWGYTFLRWFHARAENTLVTTESMRNELAMKGFDKLLVWGRGVDTDLFRPARLNDGSGPDRRLLYVGRVAAEKNIEAFLSLDIPGKKVVVGDGPSRSDLQKKYPQADWLGYLHGSELAREYAKADVFVFPSKTDTFGIVLLEAMACGVPVAAYPVAGPIDIVQPGVTGALEFDLKTAVEKALLLSRSECRRFAETQSWDQIGNSFVESLKKRAA